MSNISFLIIFGLLVLSSSGFFLKYVLKFKTSFSNCLTPLAFTLGGIFISTQLRNPSEALVFFGAAIIQFASFVFSSRFRQRSSSLWITLASLMANGTWYATMNILAASGAYWLLFVPLPVLWLCIFFQRDLCFCSNRNRTGDFAKLFVCSQFKGICEGEQLVHCSD
mgnify:CR=1 FL=1